MAESGDRNPLAGPHPNPDDDLTRGRGDENITDQVDAADDDEFEDAEDLDEEEDLEESER